MVKLPEPSDQPARVVRERVGPPRNHRRWGYDAWRRGETYRVPTGLLELEKLAKRAVDVMERHQPKADHHFDMVMDLLRLQYNLNFIVVCENCGGAHTNDELISPER